MKFADYLENAVRLERKAGEIDQPNLKALLLAQAELYRKLRNERAGWTSGPENQPDLTPPIAANDV
jgi:hypothetical protein